MDREAKVTVGEVSTSASEGVGHGIVVGHGRTVDEAIADMKSRAEIQARPVIEKQLAGLKPYQQRTREPGYWNLDFGIYDTRFAASPNGEWVAYGTLTETGTLDIKRYPRNR